VFQEVEAPRFRDNRHLKVVGLAALRTGLPYPQEIFLVLYSAGDRGNTVVKRCATNRNIAGSIADGVIGIFH